MASVAQSRLRPEDLSFRVLQADPQRIAADQAAGAVRQFLKRKRAGLAEVVKVSADPHHVILRAEGEDPQQLIDEALDLLGLGQVLSPDTEMDVDPADFTIEVAPEVVSEPEFEREVLRSRVRCFPYPDCEWFSISTGILTLSDAQVLYEPEWLIMGDHGAEKGDDTVIPLSEVEECFRGEWWDVPCLMIRTPAMTHRYGWPAERGELDSIFDVDEWLEAMRRLLGGP